VLQECPSCHARIRGRHQDDFAPLAEPVPYRRPTFCDACGEPFPWLDRQGRIYLLENMLAEEGLDPAAELEAREQLQALAQLDPNSEEAKRRWTRVRGLAPGLWEKAGGRSVLESVVAAAIKAQLGL